MGKLNPSGESSKLIEAYRSSRYPHLQEAIEAGEISLEAQNQMDPFLVQFGWQISQKEWWSDHPPPQTESLLI